MDLGGSSEDEDFEPDSLEVPDAAAGMSQNFKLHRGTQHTIPAHEKHVTLRVLLSEAQADALMVEPPSSPRNLLI